MIFVTRSVLAWLRSTRSWRLSVTALCCAAAFSPAFAAAESTAQQVDQAEKSAIPEVNPDDFVPVTSTGFDAFVVNSKVDFSQYNQVIFFPATFDRMELSRKADSSLVRSWRDSSWDEMDTICGYFDTFAKHTFKNNKPITLTRRGGDNVYAIEFRITEFHPMDVRHRDAGGGTVGTSYSSGTLGVLRARAVIANAKSGELLGVIEDTMSLSSGSVSKNNRTAQNLIWRQTFKQWLKDLRDELHMLQTQQDVALDNKV